MLKEFLARGAEEVISPRFLNSQVDDGLENIVLYQMIEKISVV
jgi:hypothetical protein